MTNSIIFLIWFRLSVINVQAPPMNVSTIPWWQVVTGIIAIPAGLLGLYYLFLQIKKILLESKKLHNEISTLKMDEEKHIEQKDLSGTVSVASEVKIKNSKIGAIKGIQGNGNMPSEVEREVKVFNKGEMDNSVVGDIVGVEYQSPTREEQS